MVSSDRTFWTPRAYTALALAALTGVATLVACKIPTGTDDMKKVLSRHGTIDAEWEVRDDANEKTHTYVLLRTKTGTHETYEIIATDGQRSVERVFVGGIDGTGCFLLEEGMTTPWVMNLPEDALEEAMPSGEKTRTKCLEYKETAAWAHVPAADRKAAEPPPPPPKPAVGPDAGMGDDAGMGEEEEPEETSGDVESVLP